MYACQKYFVKMMADGIKMKLPSIPSNRTCAMLMMRLQICETYITVYANKISLKLDLNLQPFCLLSDKMGKQSGLVIKYSFITKFTTLWSP